ncbi:MAG: single-stranded-DNA-specific exonuclease RecJ [Clostridia bacterium]|nr:single-stranded-DNA-specific exonuclease RecJ [Clostridia bacterium]
MQFKRWNINAIDRSLAAALAEECDISPFVALIAVGRGYTDPVILDEFMSDEVILADPYELRDIEKAAEIINEAVFSEQKIAVFGDYDVDGITATALMYNYLKSRNARVDYYIPSRENDGYGISFEAIDRLKAENTDLIITVDNGIAALDEVRYAKSLGMRVVVTDHHLPQKELPEADAVVNPHRIDDGSEFKEICGVFVAFKVVCAIEGRSPEEMFAEYGDLVALGTVADVMPLVNENRTAVRVGINLIANGSRRGLSALLRVAGVEDYQLTASKMAFSLGPRLNAAGRMGDAARAAELLITEDDETAEGLASVLNQENIRRQSIEKNIYSEALELVEKHGYKFNRVIVVSGKNWHSGVIGIVASRLSEKYGRPAIVLSVSDGVAYGSARSVKGFSLYDALSDSSYLLTKYGGHEMAAGLTLYENSIDSFRRAINEYAMKFERSVPEINIECKLNPAGLSVDLAEEIKALEPFGMGNPSPVFAILGVKLQRISPVGSGNHLRLAFSKGETSFQAMLFGTTASAFAYDVGDTVDLAVSLDVNFYGGGQNLTVSIKEMRPSGMDEDAVIEAVDLYEAYKSGISQNHSEIIPTRDEVVSVYKLLRQKPCSLDRLICAKLGEVGYAKTLISAAALCQLRLCSVSSADGISVIRAENTKEKVNLEDAPILKELKGGFL